MPERRERVLFAGGVALLLAAAVLAWWLWLGRQPVPSGRPPPPSPVEGLAAVQVTGQVLLRRPGAAGPVVLRGGQQLLPDDEVETGPGATVQLAAGESYRVDLEENSRFAVREITAELGRFRLAEGLMSARVRDDPARLFEVEAGPQALARTRGGDLSVSAGEGGAEVAVRRGQAEVASAGRAVVVRSGERAVVLPGAAPTDPSPIPTSLLLEVNWPRVEATNQRRLVVTGRTEPGALLAVGGQPVPVGRDGTFRAVVYLKEGPQQLSATARDAGGHRRHERSGAILLNTRGAPARFETDRLWGNEGNAPTGGRKPSP
ncbi:MAG TPA: FecR domain-containing protein [Anaeromyxobacteraceae bacterium]|nr:FecR domain-containing protein [Anaeromyxobacteraceae bacterium]